MTPGESVQFLRAVKDSAFVADRILTLRVLGQDGEERLDPLTLTDVRALPGVVAILQSHGEVIRELLAKYPDDGQIKAGLDEGADTRSAPACSKRPVLSPLRTR